MSYKDALKKGNELVVATSYNNTPHLIVAISLGFAKNRLLFGICQSYSTLRNLKKNKSICVYVKYKKKYYRIKGKATLNSNRKDLDNANKLGKGPKTKCLVSIKISEVFDLDNVKKIDL
ncbi:MAG: pyridoxamine 5'-phosphate oxidase family protein [Candidatus Woesearchaeota archaeon]